MATVRKSKGYVEEVDFGEKVSGYSSSGAIPFNNASNIPLKIRASINDSGHGAFLVDGKRAFETFVPARTRYELPISFAPPTVGAFNATLTIVFNNGSTAINGERFHNISLSGSGQNARPQKARFTLTADDHPYDSRNIIIDIDQFGDADYYEIYYSSSTSGKLKAEGYNGTGSRFTMRELDFDTEYGFTIRAYNKHGYTDSDTQYKRTEIHTLSIDIGGLIPNLNVSDKVLGQGYRIHYYEDIELSILTSSIIYCDKCNTPDERAFNEGLPYPYDTSYEPSMPDKPAFSQAKPALDTGPKVMDESRHLPLTLQIHGQVLGSGGVGGNGGGVNMLDTRYIAPPNLNSSPDITTSFDATGNKPGLPGPQFLEGGDAIHIQYDCTLNIHPTAKVMGGGGGGYGGGISRHSGYGVDSFGRAGYADANMATTGQEVMGGSFHGHNTPTHYHGRVGDDSNPELLKWLEDHARTGTLDNIWGSIDHGAARVPDDDTQSPHDHIDFFHHSATAWPAATWKGGSAKDSIDPDTGSQAGTSHSSNPMEKSNFLGGGGGAGGQGFAAGAGGKAGNTSLSNIRSHQTGREGLGSYSVAYGHQGQITEGAFPLQRGDGGSKDAPGGPSGHFRSPLYRIQSQGMNAHSLSSSGIDLSQSGDRQLYAEGLWGFWINVNARRDGRGRRRVRARAYMRSGRAIMDIRGGAGGSYGKYGEERPANSNFGGGDMINLPADSPSRDVRNLGMDNFFRNYKKTDISPLAVGRNNPSGISRADAWNIFQFEYIGGDEISMRYNGKPLLLDINNTFRQSFSVDYDAAIFMDRDQVNEGYWYDPSVVSNPTSISYSGGLRVQFPPNTFRGYNSGDLGTIGTIKPHGWPGKAIVLNGFNVSSNDGIPWAIGTCHNNNICGLVTPGKIPRLNKRVVGSTIYNREYRTFF